MCTLLYLHPIFFMKPFFFNNFLPHQISRKASFEFFYNEPFNLHTQFTREVSKIEKKKKILALFQLQKLF